MTTRIQSLKPSAADWRSFGILALVLTLWVIVFHNLQAIADWLTFRLIGLNAATHLGEAVNFFVYDVPKILLLLGGMIFLITLLRTFVTPEQTRRWLGGKREGVGNVMAAGVGVVTPFCSCSAVPLFIGFVESGIPLGVTFTFLVAAPIVNEVALVLLVGMFGWQIAGLYLLSGVTIAVLAGLLIGRLGMERYVEDFVYKIETRSNVQTAETTLSWTERFLQAFDATKDIVGKVWPFVIVGIAIGAGIHGFVPEQALANIMGQNAWWSVPVGVILGIPLYSNAAGVIPVVSVLMDKGAALGTVLAFMMSVVALSLPELIILKRVLKTQLIVIYIAVVAVGIVITGYIFNAVM